MPTDFDRPRFDASGYAIIPAVLSAAEVSELASSLIEAGEGDTARRRGEVYAIRNLLDAAPDIRRLCDRQVVRRLAENALGPECFPVQATLLDKIAEANWKVPWHQDLYIPVKKQIDVSGFCGWSEKAGVVHVKPPAEILDATVGIRLHLDECGEANGPLRVIPGSHRGGELNSDAIRDCEKKMAPVICLVSLGGALLLKPLLLHASSPSQTPAHRRVIHLLFATGKLPGGLEWHRAT
jgi:hypothetical protein